MSEATPARAERAVVRIGLVYLTTGFLVFLLMGLLGLVMRLNHAGVVPVPPEWFYRIMTLHGSGMIGAVLLAAMGGLAAVLSRSVALSVRWLWIGYLVYVAGVCLVIAATMVGRLGTGWTVLYPLPFEGKTWGAGAGATMYAGYLCVGLGFFFYCLNVARATAAAHGGLFRALAWRYLFSGGRDTSVPLPKPWELAGTVVAIDGVVAVLAGVVYLVAPFMGTGPLGQRMDPLLAKNLLMLFGHTVANLTIYLSAGLVYATLPLYTGREWKTTWPVVLALNLVTVLVLAPYFHHLYQDFVQPLPLQIVGQLASYGTGIPAVLVTILGGLGLVYRSGMRWAVPSILITLGLWGWVLGGIGAVLDGTIGINQVMHNTLWVPAHFHTYYLLGALSFALAYLYHLSGGMSGRAESGVSRGAAWLYGVGVAGFVLMFFWSGASSVPRRFAVHLPEWQSYARVAVPFVVLQVLSVGWLAIEILGRMKPAWQGKGVE